MMALILTTFGRDEKREDEESVPDFFNLCCRGHGDFEA